MYSMETWLYRDLNEAGRSKDESKIMTLGPYAWALSTLLDSCEFVGNKDDPTSMVNAKKAWSLYRGLKLTQV